MQFVADVPDDVIADANAAWQRLMARRAEDQRETLTIDNDWARQVLINNLGNILAADARETEQAATNAAVASVQTRISLVVNTPPPT